MQQMIRSKEPRAANEVDIQIAAGGKAGCVMSSSLSLEPLKHFGALAYLFGNGSF